MFGIVEVGSLGDYSFVIIVTKNHRGEYLYSKKTENDTWEFQGGHIEKQETPYEAAIRELKEEAGIMSSSIIPIADCFTDEKDTHNEINSMCSKVRNGMVFLVEIKDNPIVYNLCMEMDEVKWFEYLPEKLTYPELTKCLYKMTKIQKEES